MFSKIKLYIKLILDRMKILRLIYNNRLWKNKNKSSKDFFLTNAPIVFDLVIKEISKDDFIIWPTFGTLLGLIREKKLLDNDHDLDFGCLYDKDIQHQLRNKFDSVGFKNIFTGYIDDVIVLEKFIYNNIETDIYYFFEDGDNCFSYDFEQDGYLTVQENLDLGKKITPYKNVYSKFELKIKTINDDSFNIPYPIKNHLIELYGSNYKIPDDNWHNNKRKNRFKMNNINFTFDNHK